MRKKLFVIEDVFNITGRGNVVTGEREPDSPEFRVGSKIILVRPDGEEFITEVMGIELFIPINNKISNRKYVGVLLKNVTAKEDVPIGTEVFLNEES